MQLWNITDLCGAAAEPLHNLHMQETPPSQQIQKAVKHSSFSWKGPSQMTWGLQNPLAINAGHGLHEQTKLAPR